MDIRITRTEKMLTKALETLLEKKPLEDISVTEICELSTVRRATFYRHFADKYQFFNHYLQVISQQFMNEAEMSEELGDLAVYARHMHIALLKFSERNARFVNNNIEQAMLTETMDMVVKQIAAGIIQRLKQLPNYRNNTASAEFIGIFYAAGLLQTLRWWLKNGKPVTAEQIEKQATSLLLSQVGL
ncbi:MAG: TetR/AcrR family transcriptional regulator [Gracilibacteraceae bacterium]|jgi:AcrR family transcriptional regulator|nr:TetR/AcrR family transcriptional regulator [Gracilibacteraceae bacterium]